MSPHERALQNAITEAAPLGTIMMSKHSAERVARELKATRKAFWQMTLVAGFLTVFLIAGAVGAWKREQQQRPAERPATSKVYLV